MAAGTHSPSSDAFRSAADAAGDPGAGPLAVGPLRPIVRQNALALARMLIADTDPAAEDDVYALAAAMDDVSDREIDRQLASKRRLRRLVVATAVLGITAAAAAVGLAVHLSAPARATADADVVVRRTQDLLYPISPPDTLGAAGTAEPPDPISVEEDDPDAGAAALAPELADRTCSQGNGGACLTAGSRAEREGDLEAARNYYGRGCTLGHHARCCYHAGRMAQLLDTGATEYFTPACAAGLVPACWRLARIEWREGPSEQLTEHLRVVCDAAGADSGDACDRLGILAVRSGRLEEATSRFETACARGAMGGCGNLAHHVYNGLGGRAQDRAAGLALYAQACDGGVPSACVAEIAVRLARPDQFGDVARVVTAREQCAHFGGGDLCRDTGAR